MPGGQGKIPQRAIRVDDETWKAARAEASRRGETVSDVVRQRLREYGGLSKRTAEVE